MDELEYLRIKGCAWKKFCTLPNVHAVGIGKKVKGGVRTEEIGLTVFVTRKIPVDELNDESVVPPVFEGIRTDIVARPIPRTQQSTPALITVVPSTIPNGMRFTFSCTETPPPIGSMIVLTMTVQEGAKRSVYTMFRPSDGTSTISNLLALLDQDFHFRHGTILVGISNISDFSVTVKNPATHSLAASCYVLPIDLGQYKQDFLRGGISIQAGASKEIGTLGCIATTKPNATNPLGDVVGVTCDHIVRFPRAFRADLNATVNNTKSISLTRNRDATNQPLPIRAHNVVFVAFLHGDLLLRGTAFYTTAENDPLTKIAAGITTAINGAAVPGVTASVTSVGPENATIGIAGFSASGDSISCSCDGPPDPAIVSRMHARPENPSLNQWVFAFTGSAPWGNLGVYVDINLAGGAETLGVFRIPAPGQQLESFVEVLSKAIKDSTPASLSGLVKAKAIGSKLEISGAALVNVWIHTDIRVGQPRAFFCAANTACNQQIGRVLASRPGLDVALVKLDPGSRYKFHVEGLNAVAGTQVPSLDLAVQKRGAITGHTQGTISAIGASGFIDKGRFSRIYHNVAFIDSTTFEPDGLTRRAFSLAGDSGSVVVTTDTNPPKIVGVMFGGGDDAGALMTPIDEVIAAFSDLGLAFQPAPGTDVNAVLTVPGTASHFESNEAMESRPARRAFAAPPLAAFGQRMQEAEDEIAATPVGREYTEFFRRNLPEVLELVNHNRRVATVWHRSGGPELLNAVLRALRFDDEPLPREINGRPLGDCIARLKKILLRYGSPGFASDISRLAARYTDFAGMTYRQLLEAMRTGIPR